MNGSIQLGILLSGSVPLAQSMPPWPRQPTTTHDTIARPTGSDIRRRLTTDTVQVHQKIADMRHQFVYRATEAVAQITAIFAPRVLESHGDKRPIDAALPAAVSADGKLLHQTQVGVNHSSVWVVVRVRTLQAGRRRRRGRADLLPAPSHAVGHDEHYLVGHVYRLHDVLGPVAGDPIDALEVGIDDDVALLLEEVNETMNDFDVLLTVMRIDDENSLLRKSRQVEI